MKRIICLFLFLTLSTTALQCLSGYAFALDRGAELAQGQELFEAGKLNQALAVLRRFVQQAPDSPETAKAYTLIGRVFTKQNNYADALLYLQRIPVVLRSPEVELLHLRPLQCT